MGRTQGCQIGWKDHALQGQRHQNILPNARLGAEIRERHVEVSLRSYSAYRKPKDRAHGRHRFSNTTT